MLGWNGFIKTRGLDGVLGATDSLGAYATQILGQEQPAKDNPHVDAIVKTLTFKLKNGMPIDAGEIGLLNSAAKEGNVKAQKVMAYLNKEGAVVKDTSGLDPWLYKLSPGYWLRSKTSKEMKDVEEKKWVENAALQKQLDKAERRSARRRAGRPGCRGRRGCQATVGGHREAAERNPGKPQGHDVSDPSSGTRRSPPSRRWSPMPSRNPGRGKPPAASTPRSYLASLYSADELASARRISKIIGRMKVVHGDLIDEQNEALTMHGAFIGACVMGNIDKAIEQNATYQHLLAGMGAKVDAKQPITQDERNTLAGILKGGKALNGFTKSLVSGRAFVGCPQAKSWSRGAFVGAARALDEDDKRNLAAIIKLAKVGNPRAQRLLAYLKKSGQIADTSMGSNRTFIGSDNVGWLGTALKWTTAPVWAPAYGIYKGSKWTGQQLGIVSKGGPGSPEQQRLNMMRAAAKRRQAAEARAAAADAQTAAEQRAHECHRRRGGRRGRRRRRPGPRPRKRP